MGILSNRVLRYWDVRQKVGSPTSRFRLPGTYLQPSSCRFSVSLYRKPGRTVEHGYNGYGETEIRYLTHSSPVKGLGDFFCDFGKCGVKSRPEGYIGWRVEIGECMMYFVLPGSDPSPRTPNCALRGETGREEGGIIGGLERGVEGESEIRESVRGKRARGGEGNAPPVTPGGTTGDSPPQGCASTDMADLGGLDGSRGNPWGVSDESGNPTMPAENPAGEGTTRENDCPAPSERLSDDLWTRHPLLTALGRGNGEFRPGGEPRAEGYRLPLPLSPFAAEIAAGVYALLVSRLRLGMDAHEIRDGLLRWLSGALGVEAEWFADDSRPDCAICCAWAREGGSTSELLTWAESLSKNTQDAEQTAGGGCDGDS